MPLAVKPCTRRLMPLALAVALGCQDYNFNPVGHCLVQPGSERVTLSDVSSADVLFVVDDSGSMAGEQGRLAAGFDTFIANLDASNVARRAAGLEPIDFHLAVTTTSVFFNGQTSAFCRSDCPGAGGAQVCCNVSGSTPQSVLANATRCTSNASCGAGTTCRTDCIGFAGQQVCCGDSRVPPEIACPTAGAACGFLETRYRFDPGSNCATDPARQGVGVNGAPFPQGAFVGRGTNPRVLHFDKELYPAPGSGLPAVNRQGFSSAQLISFFKENVVVGTCGSGQEQGLQAGRLALQKAIAGQQRDTRARTDGATVTDVAADWPVQGRASKLVVVYLGDEDDCSSPQNAAGGVILSGAPGSDSCVADASQASRKQFAVGEMVDYLATLGRPLGAAFIVSTQSTDCVDASCVPGLCCDTACTGSASVCRDDVCGGQAAGSRLLDAAAQFRAKGADVVAGSMCSATFGAVLNRIAEIVKPPTGLVLPTVPAASDITVLRIATAGGSTRKTCRGPAPSTLTATQARDAGWDWWFTREREQLTPEQRKPTAATQFVYINQDTGACQANAGETYAAEYLGRLPAAGCQTRADCARALGGRSEAFPNGDWTCYAGGTVDSGFTAPTPAAPGTCICGGGQGTF